MPTMTAFMFDRIMSLHRRAYECEDRQAWEELAIKLDCPVEARDQFWKTAEAARDAGMSKEKAFPLTGDFPNHPHGVCGLCSYPNKPDGCCSRKDCANSD